MSRSKIFVALASLAAVVSVASPAMASTWAQRHPRQREVLTREHRQITRINHERRDGELTGRQARMLRARDRHIVRQDHVEARANGGYITPHQQNQINREENGQSHAIGH